MTIIYAAYLLCLACSLYAFWLFNDLRTSRGTGGKDEDLQITRQWEADKQHSQIDALAKLQLEDFDELVRVIKSHNPKISSVQLVFAPTWNEVIIYDAKGYALARSVRPTVAEAAQDCISLTNSVYDHS